MAALLLCAAGVAAFVSLGLWQLRRADAKQQLLDRLAGAAAAPVQPFAQVPIQPAAGAFPHVQVHGRYLVDRLYLLDNPEHDRRGGAEVFAPLQLPGTARVLLVDLGFLPGDGSGRSPAVPPVSDRVQTLRGLYQPPPGVGFRMGGDALAAQRQWPKSSVYLDPAEVAADLGRPVDPGILSLDPAAGSLFQRHPAAQMSTMPPARHRAYAFQWFSMAAAAIVILAVLHRPGSRPNTRTKTRSSRTRP